MVAVLSYRRCSSNILRTKYLDLIKVMMFRNCVRFKIYVNILIICEISNVKIKIFNCTKVYVQ